MLKISARNAVRNLRNTGDFGRLSTVSADTAQLGYEESTGDMAGARVFGEFTPRIEPKFTLGANPWIFTSGSCFAREIELSLYNAGKTVISWNLQTN